MQNELGVRRTNMWNDGATQYPDSMFNFGQSLTNVFNALPGQEFYGYDSLATSLTGEQGRWAGQYGEYGPPGLQMASDYNITRPIDRERMYESQPIKFFRQAFCILQVLNGMSSLTYEAADWIISERQEFVFQTIQTHWAPASAASLSTLADTASRSVHVQIAKGSRMVGTAESYKEILTDPNYGPEEKAFMIAHTSIQLAMDAALCTLAALDVAATRAILEATNGIRAAEYDIQDLWTMWRQHNRYFGIITRQGSPGMVKILGELRQRIATATGGDPSILVYMSHRAASILDDDDVFQDSEKSIQFSKLMIDPLLQQKMGMTVDRSAFNMLAYTNELTVRGRSIKSSNPKIRIFKLSPPGTAQSGDESDQTLLDGYGVVAEQCSKNMVNTSGIDWERVASGPCSLEKPGLDGNWHKIDGYQMLPYTGWWEQHSGSQDIYSRGGETLVDTGFSKLCTHVTAEEQNSADQESGGLARRFDELSDPEQSYKLGDQMTDDEAYVLRDLTPGNTFIQGGRGEIHVGPLQMTGGAFPDFLRFRYIDQICTKSQSVLNTLRLGDGAAHAVTLNATSAIAAIVRAANAINNHLADAYSAADADGRARLANQVETFVGAMLVNRKSKPNRHDQVQDFLVESDTGGYTIPPYNEGGHGDAFLAGCSTGPMLMEIAKIPETTANTWPPWAKPVWADAVNGVRALKSLHQMGLSRVMKYAAVLRREGLSPWFDTIDLDDATCAITGIVAALVGDLVAEFTLDVVAGQARGGFSRDAFNAAFIGSNGDILLNEATNDQADDDLFRDRAASGTVFDADWATLYNASLANSALKVGVDQARAFHAVYVRLRRSGLDSDTVATVVNVVADEAVRVTAKLTRETLNNLLERVWQATRPGFVSAAVDRPVRTVLAFPAIWSEFAALESALTGTGLAQHMRGIRSTSDNTIDSDVADPRLDQIRLNRADAMDVDEGDANNYPRVSSQRADWGRRHVSTGPGRAVAVRGGAPIPGAGHGKFEYLNFLHFRMDAANSFWLRHRLDEYLARYKTIKGRELHFLLFLCYISTPFTLQAMQNWMEEYIMVGTEKFFVPPPFNLVYTWYGIEYEKSDILACAAGACKIFASPTDARWIYDPMSSRVFMAVYQRRAHIVPRPEMTARIDNAWVRIIGGTGFTPLDLGLEYEKGTPDPISMQARGQFVVTMSPVSSPKIDQCVTHSDLLKTLRSVQQHPDGRDHSIRRAPWFGQNVFFNVFTRLRETLKQSVDTLRTNASRVSDLGGNRKLHEINMPLAIESQQGLRARHHIPPFIYRGEWRSYFNGKELSEDASPQSPLFNKFWFENARRRNAGHPDEPATMHVRNV